MARLVRSRNKMIAGVCAGVAEYFGWSVSKVRLVWLLLAILTIGAPVVFYIVLWFVMPDAVSLKQSYTERMNRRLGR